MVSRRRALLATPITLAILLLASLLSSAAQPHKTASYDGLVFQVPTSWHVDTPAQTEPCGAALPAVIVGSTRAPAHNVPKCLFPIDRVGTDMKILPVSEAGGCSANRGVTQSGATVESFRHDGLTITVNLDTFSGAQIAIAWTFTACFSQYPKVAIFAYSGRGPNEGALAQALEVVKSARPTGHS